jgi:hypothetical protein
MGADMILSVLWIGKKKNPDFKKGEALIQKLAMTPAEEWPKEFIDRFNDDIMIGPMVDELSQSLNEVKRSWSGNHREAAFMEMCGRRILVTGGLSWGDAPTDLMGDIDNLLSSGVAKACGFSG